MPGRETCRVGGEADVMVEMGDTPVDAVCVFGEGASAGGQRLGTDLGPKGLYFTGRHRIASRCRCRVLLASCGGVGRRYRITLGP